jgi:thiol-disulfide isomerase/thioredoxin
VKALLVGILLLCCFGTAQASERVVPINAQQLGAELERLSGRVVLINYWATWCMPCLREIPALIELESELSEQGFSVVAVSLDELADVDAIVEPFLADRFPEFTSFISAENDMDSIVSVVDPFWNEVLPTSYLLARDGTVAAKIQGGKSGEDFAAAIRPLLEAH